MTMEGWGVPDCALYADILIGRICIMSRSAAITGIKSYIRQIVLSKQLQAGIIIAMAAANTYEVFSEGRVTVKRYVLLAEAFLLCFILAACGAKEDASQRSESTWIGMAPEDDLAVMAERTEYYDLTAQSERIFDLGLWEKNDQTQRISETVVKGGKVYLLLATQFWKGEPVQLWTETSSGSSSLWLYRKDGSGELLLENVPREYGTYGTYEGRYKWYMDQNGDFYCYRTNYVSINEQAGSSVASIVKILSSGETLYKAALDPGIGIKDFCQTEDGRIYLLLQEDGEEKLRLAEMDSATGELIAETKREISFMGERAVALGAAGNVPAVEGYCDEDRNHRILKADQVSEDMTPVLYFAGTSYTWSTSMYLQDFRVLEDGSIELLMTDVNGLNCSLERLKMGKVERIPIVVRGGCFVDNTFREQVALFNQENDTYQVIIEDCVNLDDRDDFARLTSVQMNAGKGPDILYGNDLMKDYIVGMLEKGALEDLSPYMEASGIREEDYFPLTFSAWRQGEKIYGAIYRAGVWQHKIDEKVLGSRETPDIETLLDALLAQEEECVYVRGADSGKVLSYWLEGTDSLWGMVDWERGSCDFNTPLFEKLLEAARRYGDDGRKDSVPAVANIANYANVLYFSGLAELEADGQVLSGILFDDGCYAAFAPDYILAVNANSTHKEGAWEFIRFLLSEEIQGTTLDHYETPVNRKVFDEWMEMTIVKMTQIEYINGVPGYKPAFYGEEVSEERKEEYVRAIEAARPRPLRTTFINEIILKEAEDYFNGYKSAEEVSKVINNRVQLYLDENR